MDAFFAAVEQRNNPSLRGKPVAVGGSSNRGVIAAASYEARKYGVKSAMPTVMAMAKCPNLILVKPNGKAYREASDIIHSIFFDYTDMVEPLSLDEAFLDVTFQNYERQSATLLAQEIRSRIYSATGLTASAGVSYNKFLAKIASDVNKPNGIFVIPPEDAVSFLEKLEIERFFGVGKAAAEKFHQLGVSTGLDLKRFTKEELTHWFGKAGAYYYNIVLGVDNREVKPFRERKSIGAEETFEWDLVEINELKARLLLVIERMWKVIDREGVEGKTVTLKIKYFDFEMASRSHTLDIFVNNKNQIIKEALILLQTELPLKKPVRLLGVTLSNFKTESDNPEQMTFNF